MNFQDYKWPIRFLDMADLVASWSKDPSTKVGAVITDTMNRVLGVGFNGLPRGVSDSSERLSDREIKLALTLHAEDNAITFASGDLRGATIHVTRPPCSHCAAKIVQSGIATVYSPQPPASFSERWAVSLGLARSLFEEAGVRFVTIPDSIRKKDFTK